MAGYDEQDPTSVARAPDDYGAELANPLRGVRLGLPEAWCFSKCDAQVEELTRQALDALASLGATVLPIELPNAHLADLSGMGWAIMGPELAALHAANKHRLAEYWPDIVEQIVRAHLLSAVDYAQALRARSVLQSDFAAAFGTVDAVVSPAANAPPPALDDMTINLNGRKHPWGEVICHTIAIYNLTGLPALTVPMGLTDGGLPAGLQIAAGPFKEALCLRIGHAFQQVTDHHRLPPPMLR
jgi:aspartyl-tRNA(Asn)/glutamyl-tRNA(Gln) amidotransferase subunit A